MSHPDNIARALSIVALVIASGSLFFAARTFWRAGARVTVNAEKKLHHMVMFVGDAVYDDVVSVAVSNRGLAPIQVTAMYFETKGRRGPVDISPGGNTLPYLLPGNHEEPWTPAISTILDPSWVDAGQVVRVRIGVRLGNGKQAVSGWFDLRDEDVVQ